MHLLIVEDDDAIAAPLQRAVEREGYRVTRLAAGRAAVELLAAPDAPADPVDVVLLDLGLPDMDGLDVCREVRASGYEGGILILTARAGELDRVVGLDVGADDYLAKPFSLSELLARLRALVRRTRRAAPAAAVAPDDEGEQVAPNSARATAVHALRIDRAARRAWVADAELPLTAKEFDVLALLDDQRGAVVRRETLMAEVWDENWFGSTKTLDATVGRLRQKLQDAAAPVVLGNVRGIGFRLEDG